MCRRTLHCLVIHATVAVAPACFDLPSPASAQTAPATVIRLALKPRPAK